MTTTLRTVAEACGIDISTVSRALRGDPRVAATTVTQVQAVAERLGYRPNLAARALQAGSTRTVWLITGSLEAGVERLLASEAAAAIEPAGYDLLIASHHDQSLAFERLCGRLEQGVTDAALVIAPNSAMPASPALERLIARRWPLVFLDRSPGSDQYPTVTSDNAGATRSLVQRLAADGAKRLAICPGPNNTVASMRTLTASAEAQRLGLDVMTNPNASWLTSAHSSLAIFATSQHEIHAFCRHNANHLRNVQLTAAVFDAWIGEPHPMQSVVVGVQDFAALATRAAHRVLAAIADPLAWSSANDHLPPLRIDKIDSRFK